MPNDQFRDETDGDPQTEYEDTDAVHDRTGFRVDDGDKMRTDAHPKQTGVDADLSPAVIFNNQS